MYYIKISSSSIITHIQTKFTFYIYYYAHKIFMSALIVNALCFVCISTSGFLSYVILSHNCCSVCSI